MKARLASILVGILALTFGSAALAQTPPAQRGVESSITGTLVSSTGSSLVIRTENGAEQSFEIDSSSSMPADLAPGSRVTVRYHALEGGRQHAASVTRGDAITQPAPVLTVPATSLTAPTSPDSVPTTPVMPPPTVAVMPTMPDLAPAPEPMMAADPNAGDRLPETASEMPMLAFAGLMTIAAGLVLRELRRREA